MARDTQRKHTAVYIIVREMLLNGLTPRFSFFRITGISCAKPDIFSRKPSRQFTFKRFNHDPPGAFPTADFFIRIQLVSLYLQHWLNIEYAAHCCRGRRDPAAFLKIFLSIHCNKYTCIKPCLFKNIPNFFCRKPLLYKIQCIQYRLALCC